MNNKGDDVPDPVARLRAVTDDEVKAALDACPGSELLEWFEPADLVQFVNCLANHMFGEQ